MLQKLPYLIAVLSMIAGVFISILFGVNERLFKDKIQQGLQQNQKIQSIIDPEAKAAKVSQEASKNWRYYQRFHFHSTGIAAMSLALLLLISLIQMPKNFKLVTSYMVAIGGFLYPFVWLFAAIYGPEMGRHEAKEAFAIFGYMGGIFMVGCLLTLVMAAKYPIKHVSAN